MIKAPYAGASAVITLGGIFERGLFFLGRFIFLGVIINFKDMPRRIMKPEAPPMTQIPIRTSDGTAQFFNRGHPALQRLGT